MFWTIVGALLFIFILLPTIIRLVMFLFDKYLDWKLRQYKKL